MKLAKVTTQVSNQAQRYTQMDLVLAILQMKGAVTKKQLLVLEVKTPSAVICSLRYAGYDIKTEFVKRSPWGIQAEYSLYRGNSADAPPLFIKRDQEAV